MPVDSQIRLADGEHVVQFYENDDDLVTFVTGYLGAATVAGDAVVVIATPDHAEAFLSALGRAGVDVEAARQDGRLVILDAATTLSRFMIGDAPDAAAFDAVVGDLVRRAGAGGRPVRAYGEMVALLWAAGNVTGSGTTSGRGRRSRCSARTRPTWWRAGRQRRPSPRCATSTRRWWQGRRYRMAPRSRAGSRARSTRHGWLAPSCRRPCRVGAGPTSS